MANDAGQWRTVKVEIADGIAWVIDGRRVSSPDYKPTSAKGASCAKSIY
jgi:hypothetical protein